MITCAEPTKVLDKIPPLMLKALLLPLAKLLLQAANQDQQVAWDNAVAYVKTFDPRSASELRLAIRVAIYNLQSNEALAQAGDPATTTSQAIRLRTGAMSLARNADKAENQLKKLRSERSQSAQPAAEKPAPQAPDSTRPIPLIPRGNQDYRQRKLEKRLARRQEREARLQAALPKAA